MPTVTAKRTKPKGCRKIGMVKAGIAVRVKPELRGEPPAKGYSVYVANMTPDGIIKETWRAWFIREQDADALAVEMMRREQA